MGPSPRVLRPEDGDAVGPAWRSPGASVEASPSAWLASSPRLGPDTTGRTELWNMQSPVTVEETALRRRLGLALGDERKVTFCSPRSDDSGSPQRRQSSHRGACARAVSRLVVVDKDGSLCRNAALGAFVRGPPLRGIAVSALRAWALVPVRDDDAPAIRRLASRPRQALLPLGVEALNLGATKVGVDALVPLVYAGEGGAVRHATSLCTYAEAAAEKLAVAIKAHAVGAGASRSDLVCSVDPATGECAPLYETKHLDVIAVAAPPSGAVDGAKAAGTTKTALWWRDVTFLVLCRDAGILVARAKRAALAPLALGRRPPGDPKWLAIGGGNNEPPIILVGIGDAVFAASIRDHCLVECARSPAKNPVAAFVVPPAPSEDDDGVQEETPTKTITPGSRRLPAPPPGADDENDDDAGSGRQRLADRYQPLTPYMMGSFYQEDDKIARNEECPETDRRAPATLEQRPRRAPPPPPVEAPAEVAPWRENLGPLLVVDPSGGVLRSNWNLTEFKDIPASTSAFRVDGLAYATSTETILALDSERRQIASLEFDLDTVAVKSRLQLRFDGVPIEDLRIASPCVVDDQLSVVLKWSRDVEATLGSVDGDAIARVDLTTGDLDVVHVFSRRDVLALASRSDDDGFFFWSRADGLCKLDTSGERQMSSDRRRRGEGQLLISLV